MPHDPSVLLLSKLLESSRALEILRVWDALFDELNMVKRKNIAH